MINENTKAVQCPYCGTTLKKNMNTHRTVCECRRLHEYKDFNNEPYNVLYRKDGTKEVGCGLCS